MRELKSPNLQHLVCQPARAQPGEACHHYHRGLYSSLQRQSQKCTAATQGIPSIQISTSDIILGFCESMLWFTRCSQPTIPVLCSFHVQDLSTLWCKNLTCTAHLWFTEATQWNWLVISDIFNFFFYQNSWKPLNVHKHLLSGMLLMDAHEVMLLTCPAAVTAVSVGWPDEQLGCFQCENMHRFSFFNNIFCPSCGNVSL